MHTEWPPLAYKVYPFDSCYREVVTALNGNALQNLGYGRTVLDFYVITLVLPQDIST